MMYSPNYHHLAHLKIPLKDILSATNNFAEENVIEEADIGNAYKGHLAWSGELNRIHAQRWSNKEWDGEKEQQFWMEISLLSSLKHKNLVSLVGFCDENDEKIIVIKLETRASLGNYLSDSRLLTWVRRLEICVGLANALSYIHYDELRDFSIIHRSIDSETVLLNDNWEPKLSKFMLSMKIKASQRSHSFDNDKVPKGLGYTDPIYLQTKSAHYNSDIYSFGIVLFELLCGRKSVIDERDNKYLAPVAMFHYREKILDDIIEPDLLKQMDPESSKVFAKTAYDCLNEERSRRPDIGEVVTRLEEALKLQLTHENRPERLIVAAEVGGTPSNHEKGSVTSIYSVIESHVSNRTMSSVTDLSGSKLIFQDTESAANGFADENIPRKYTFGRILKSHVLHCSNMDIIAKRFHTEYVKDISKRFWKEVLMLSSLNIRI